MWRGRGPTLVGRVVGKEVGPVGVKVGSVVGAVGSKVGDSVGAVGASVGTSVGAVVGRVVGSRVGRFEGVSVGGKVVGFCQSHGRGGRKATRDIRDGFVVLCRLARRTAGRYVLNPIPPSTGICGGGVVC